MDEGKKKIRLRWIWFPLLMVSLLLVTFPRFNRNDLFLVNKFTGKDINDSFAYITCVKYFRGEAGYNELRLPFTYRPFVPFLASLLPFSPMMSLNIINFTSLAIAILILFYLLLKICKLSFSYSIGGCFMFILSFPAFYYGTIGYIDSVLILFLILCTYFIFSEKITFLVITFIIGCLVKETIALIVPVFFVYNYLQGKPWKLILMLLLIFYFGITWMMRSIYVNLGQCLWMPSIPFLVRNLTRWKGIVSTLLTFGVPGFLFLILLRKYRQVKILLNRPIYYSLIVGFFMSLMLTFYAVIAAYLDGRFIWTSYPFTIPLSLLLLNAVVIKSKIIKRGKSL